MGVRSTLTSVSLVSAGLPVVTGLATRAESPDSGRWQQVCPLTQGPAVVRGQALRSCMLLSHGVVRPCNLPAQRPLCAEPGQQCERKEGSSGRSEERQGNRTQCTSLEGWRACKAETLASTEAPSFRPCVCSCSCSPCLAGGRGSVREGNWWGRASPAAAPACLPGEAAGL